MGYIIWIINLSKYLEQYSILFFHLPIIISSMLKGILPQLNSINTYIQSILPLEHQDLTWQIYLLNTEKNTFQILKLVQIILSQLEEHLPKGVKYQFQRCSNLLKQYFKCRPKLEIDHEDHDKHLHTQEYDQVQHYLDNKPQIDINNEQRSQLFKFLSINDQKQKDNVILLESIPRYNFDYSYNRNSSHQNKSISNKNKPKLSEFSKVIIKKCESETIENCSSQVNIFKFTEEAEVQTETIHLQNQLKNDAWTSMTDFIEHTEANDTCKKYKITGEGKKENQNQGKKKKRKKSTKDDENKISSESKSNQIIGQNEMGSGQKRVPRASAMASDGKTIKDLSNIEISKQEKAKKKRQSKRQSTNSILSNKKEIKSIFSKDSQKRLSKDFKDPKQNKIFNQSKFNKQKKNGANQYPTTILQTKQELTNSYLNAQIFTENEAIILNQQSLEPTINCNNSRVVINIPTNNKVTTEDSITKQQDSRNINHVNQKSEPIQRVKISSNKEDIKQYQSIQEKSYANTIGHPFYKKISKNEKSHQKIDNRSLPKIQQKSNKIKYQSIQYQKKKKTYQNSPYAKPSIELLSNQKIVKNPSLNHRSFHLNPLQTKFAFSPTSFNRTQKTQKAQKSQQDLDGSFKNCNSSPKFEINLANYVGEVERQVMLEEEHNKIVKYIEQNMVNKLAKDFQWSKIMKNIKTYQHLHLNLCGQNCVHLNKFYQFLKKKNLSIYANRKELLLHKKNIEINTH